MSIFNRKSFNFEQAQGLVVNPSRRSDFSYDLRKSGTLSEIREDLDVSFQGVEGACDEDSENLVRECIFEYLSSILFFHNKPFCAYARDL